MCAVPEQGPLEASGVGRRVSWRGAGAAPEGEASVPTTCRRVPARLWRAPSPGRRGRRGPAPAVLPPSARAGRPLGASGPRARGSGGRTGTPGLRLPRGGSEDVPRRAPSRRVPHGASPSRSQARCAPGPRRWPRSGVPAGRAGGQRCLARGARGRRGLALGARRRRGLQRPGAALPLAALSEPQRLPSTRAASGQGEQQTALEPGGSWMSGAVSARVTLSRAQSVLHSQADILAVGSVCVRRLRVRVRWQRLCGSFPRGQWMEPGVWVMVPVDSVLLLYRQWKDGMGADDWRSRWHI